MADTRKPDYFFTPDVGEEVDSSLELICQEVTATEVEVRCGLDFEEIHARWWPDDPFE